MWTTKARALGTESNETNGGREEEEDLANVGYSGSSRMHL